MSRTKLVVLARSLTLLASVGAPCLAHAADLLPPPPPPPMPAPIEVGGGWYLRGDIGVGAAEFSSITLRPADVAPAGYAVTNDEISSQFFGGGGVGYQFNGFLRADVTGEYRGGSRIGFVETFPSYYVGSHAPGTGIDANSANLSSVVVMANGYFDLGTWYGLTPFIGAGIGSAFHTVSGYTDFGAGTAAGGFGIAKSKDTSSLAWAVQAGVSYDVTPNFKVDVGYRYINMGKAKTGSVQCYDQAECGWHYTVNDLTSHDVKIGLRYLLGGAVAAPLPPLVPDYAPPGPIVRKY